MKRAFYESLRWYVRLGLLLYFKTIRLEGKGNIPVKGPVLFTANHQNAFLDALLIVAFSGRYTYFLTRASIFSNGIVCWILGLINLIPIYRMRDGKASLANNEAVFRQCYSILAAGHALIIFPEGNHDIRRKLRPLSKGFTRIAYGAIEHTPLQSLSIVPIGINYSAHTRYRSGVSLYFGRPVIANPEQEDARQLTLQVATAMKSLTVHIPHDYDRIDALLQQTGVDYLDPHEVNTMIENKTMPKENSGGGISWTILPYPIVWLNNVVIIALWKLMARQINDPAFVGSIKFAFGIFVVPLIYLAQASLVFVIWGIWPSLWYLLFTLFTAPFLAKGNAVV